LRKLLRFALARAEAGTPEQPLCLSGSETSPVCGGVRQNPPLSASAPQCPTISPEKGRGPTLAGPLRVVTWRVERLGLVAPCLAVRLADRAEGGRDAQARLDHGRR